VRPEARRWTGGPSHRWRMAACGWRIDQSMMSKPLRAFNHGLFNGNWYHTHQSSHRPSQEGGEPLGWSPHPRLDEGEKAGPEK